METQQSVVEVHVTAADIANGVKRECVSCPIALALGRAFAVPERHASINSLDWDVYVPYRQLGRDLLVLISRKTDQQQKDFMMAFDRGDPVEPFSFQVELTEEERRKLATEVHQ